jgi:hypothetical protein
LENWSGFGEARNGLAQRFDAQEFCRLTAWQPALDIISGCDVILFSNVALNRRDACIGSNDSLKADLPENLCMFAI